MPDGAREMLPCVWVAAGVLNYRLCDREYDCEGCDLFHALRGDTAGASVLPPEFGAGTGAGRRPSAGPSAADDVDQYFCELLAGCTLQLDRYYSPGHLWVAPGSEGRLAIGIDGHVLRVLHPVDDVLPPRPGTWLKRGEACGWIVRGRRSIPLLGPIAGEVVAINDTFLTSLRAQRNPAAGDAWLMHLEAHESPETIPELARGEEALVHYLREIRTIKQVLREAGGDPGLGTVMTDGGRIDPNLEQVLGASRYEALVDALFRLQIS